MTEQSDQGDPLQRLTGRLPAPLRAVVAARDPSPRTRRVLLAVAAAAFVVGLALSVHHLDVGLQDVSWPPLLLVALVLTPLTILGNAAELKVMAAYLRTASAKPAPPLGWLESCRIVILATAANLLPIPGAAIVRIQALRIRGASGAAATGMNLAAATGWLGSGLVVAGLALLPFAGVAAGVALLCGAGGVVATGLLVRWALRGAAAPRVRAASVALLAVELLITVLHGVRLLAVLVALQVDLGLLQALVIGLSAPLSAAAGVFPSGLGLAEGLSALLAPLVALPAAAGFAATALNRVVGLAVTAPLAVLLGLRVADDGVRATDNGQEPTGPAGS